jgi:hypothetical protein
MSDPSTNSRGRTWLIVGAVVVVIAIILLIAILAGGGGSDTGTGGTGY